jgi:polyhydroxybutyrate depolymerase
MKLRRSLLAMMCALGSVLGSAAACSSTTDQPGQVTDAGPGANDATSGADTSAPPSDGSLPDTSPPPDANDPDVEPPPPPPPPDLLTRESIQVGSRTRAYGVRLPKTYDPAVAYPLVMVFHGNGGDGAAVYSAFKYQSASGDNAVLVYPDAENLDWDLYTPAASNKDIAFMEALVPALAAKYGIDTTKVFGFGWSNGAFFVNQVACRRSAFFRGIASMAGGAPYEPSDPNRKWPNGFQKCPDETAVPFIGFHGTNDPVVDYSGGEFSATYWGYVNGCAASRTATTPAPCEEHANCTSGKPVVFCPVPGIGHGIWSQAATASWDFFQTL